MTVDNREASLGDLGNNSKSEGEGTEDPLGWEKEMKKRRP